MDQPGRYPPSLADQPGRYRLSHADQPGRYPPTHADEPGRYPPVTCSILASVSSPRDAEPRRRIPPRDSSSVRSSK